MGVPECERYNTTRSEEDTVFCPEGFHKGRSDHVATASAFD